MSELISDRDVRLVLHPGHPKCGSSSIQHALYSNRSVLREQGVIIPTKRPNRVFIRACERGNFQAAAEWLEGLLADVQRARANVVVVSAENLSVRRLVTDGRPIHELFAQRFSTVSVIYYIRRQDDWMVSQWQQWGHQRGLSLGQFIEGRLADQQPDYLTAARCFEEVYGSESVSVVPIHRAGLVSGDLICDFSHRSGVGPLLVKESNGRKNVSMSGFMCDVLARVPHIYDQDRAARVSEGMTDRSVPRLLEQSVGSRELLFSGDKRIMSTQQRRRVLVHFEDDNRVLHERYFPDVPFEEVFGVSKEVTGGEIKALQDHLDGMRDILAIQMELIVGLLRKQHGDGGRRNAGRWLGSLRRWLGAGKSREISGKGSA